MKKNLPQKARTGAVDPPHSGTSPPQSIVSWSGPSHQEQPDLPISLSQEQPQEQPGLPISLSQEQPSLPISLSEEQPETPFIVTIVMIYGDTHNEMDESVLSPYN